MFLNIPDSKTLNKRANDFQVSHLSGMTAIFNLFLKGSAAKSLSAGMLTACTFFSFSALAEEQAAENKNHKPDWTEMMILYLDANGEVETPNENEDYNANYFLRWEPLGDSAHFANEYGLGFYTDPRSAVLKDLANNPMDIQISFRQAYGDLSKEPGVYVYLDQTELKDKNDGSVTPPIYRHLPTSSTSTNDGDYLPAYIVLYGVNDPEGKTFNKNDNVGGHLYYNHSNGRDSAENLTKVLLKNLPSEGNNPPSITGDFIRNNQHKDFKRNEIKTLTYKYDATKADDYPGISAYKDDKGNAHVKFVLEDYTNEQGELTEKGKELLASMEKEENNIESFAGGTVIYNTVYPYSDDLKKTPTDEEIIGKEGESPGGLLTKKSVLGDISGNFIGNYVQSNDAQILGGVIYNGFNGVIGNITGTFIGNNTQQYGTKTSHGGVIYNHLNGIINKIDGVFVGNFSVNMNIADKTSDRIDIIGGVIVNHGMINKGVHGTFIRNYAYSVNTANSGVLRNYSGPGYMGVLGADEYDNSLSGTFIGNFARAVDGDAYGGIMRNNGTLEGNIEGIFIGNYAQAEGSPSKIAGGTKPVASYGVYTVNREGDPVGKYRYDTWENAYILFEKDTKENQEKYKDKYVLEYQGKEIYHTGERTGLAQGGAFYNTIKTDGTAGTSVKIEKISGLFDSNYVLSTWSEASGGAIYNQDALIKDIEASFIGNHAVSLAHKARGGAIYNNLLLMDETKIGEIGTTENPVEFYDNYAQGRIAGGGAIYVSSYATMQDVHADFIGNYALSKLDLSEEDMVKYNDPTSHFGQENGTRDDDRDARARGGALFVDNYGEVGKIYADFTGNYVKSDVMDAEQEKAIYGTNANVRGGAILVTTNGLIGHIAGREGDGSLAMFRENYALGAEPNLTYGGAIRFDASVIDTLSANFDGNYTNGSGGALSLTETGFIYQVTGKFENNIAGLVGGAVHNLGTIGYLGHIVVRDPKTGATTIYDHIPDDEIGLYKHANRLKSGRIETISDETKGDNKVGYKEYDGTIQGGFRNVQFIGNKVDGRDGDEADDKYVRKGGDRGLGGAIYTEGDIFIVADDPNQDNYTEFKGNEVIYHPDYGKDDYVQVKDDNMKHLNTALYVQKAANVTELPTIYLVAEKGGHIIIEDAIRGAEPTGTEISEGFVLRMRGYSRKGFHYEHTDTTGIIEISGPVAQSYSIMDDVTLRIGRCINYFTFGENPLHEPEKYIFEQEKTDKFGRSDVFRKSHLSVRSGTVDLTSDEGISQFLFGTLTAYGYTWRYADYGAKDVNVKDTYEVRDVYAKWAVDIDAKDKVADLITTFEIRSDDGKEILKAQNKNEQKSTGRITLANINIKRADGSFYHYDENGKTGDNDYGLDRETSLKVQVLNLVVRNANGDVFGQENYEKWGYLTDAAPIQLDNALRVVKWESSIMSSDEVLAEDIWLATTRTYHDSIEIIGWRDSLAAWAEMNDDITTANYDDSGWKWDTDEDGNDTAKTQTKVFTLVREKATHTLTRDVVDLKDKKSGPAERGAVWGKDWTIRGEDRTLVLDMNRKNLLTIVTAGQKARLENFTLQNVKDNDLLNEGELTLDTMTMHEKEMVVNNDNSLTVQGVMDIDFTITTDTTRRAAGADKEMIIDDRSHVTEGRTLVNIEGTVESQNITVKEELNKTALPADPSKATSATFADANFTTVVNLPTTQADGETVNGAFTRFTQQDKLNSLHMEGGKFNLGVMHDHVLRLKNWSMKGGAMYVAASTVDLAAEKMGGIRADHASLDPANSGIIWLDKMVIRNDGKGLVTHVQFVNEEMGDAVQDNEIRNTIRKGNIWYYEVTYNNKTLKNDRGESGKNGWYTFRRLTDRVTPEVQTGASASLAGAYVSMLQVYDYSFEHADLFSSTMANSILNRFDAYSYVTPVKGYKAAPVPAADPCPTNKAGLQNALWVRPYASFEKLPLANGPRVDTNLYGALFGGDSDLREHRGGWAEVTSIFGTYMGATKRYEGIRSRENGLGIGATETLYKGNFYTALTATVGTSFGSTHTAFGNEKYNTLMAGIASRTGYTMPLGSCRYVLQPTLLMSYSFINVSDYTNASGVRMESSPLQVFQLHPYLKGIMHTDSGWDPYVTLGYVHNFMGKTKFRANGEKLPELSIDPYVEYSLGVQKTWKDKYTLYGQATGRHGGRNGAEVSIGIRWAW